MKTQPIVIVAAAALMAASLSGCVVAGLGAAAGGAGYLAGQERGAGGIASDSAIRAQIADKWYKYNTDMYSQLNLSVYQGRAVVTGAVSNPDWKVEAVKLAWQAEGVKEVHSEIELAQKSTIADDARDTWISTRLRSAITFEPKIRSLNYSIETVNGTVYLMGSARTQGELDLVTDYARNIPNVKRVVSYVQVRPGEPVPAMAQPAAPPPPGPAPVVQQVPVQPGAPIAQQPTMQPTPTMQPAPANSAPMQIAPPAGRPVIESRPLS